ncbi:MAG: argininosuccinate lyase [Acidimicrobiia bacterium]
MSDDGAGGGTLWHGRFASAPADALMALSRSIDFDRRLWQVDIQGSRAHVAMLREVGLLVQADSDAILSALAVVAREFETNTIEILDSDEDIHSVIERRVTEIAGDAGARLHTGRSRNDQVATDMRLWLKSAAADIDAALDAFQAVLVSRATTAGEAAIPGYTHLQRAQPVMLSHHLLAHFWAFERDRGRLADLVRRADVSVLGAGALAGSSLPLDPSFSATELGFAAVFENSLDAVSDRDFLVEYLNALALIQVHCSRIGEEVVLWTTEEFGFATLDDAYATGSSMLPQKKNPDIAELARGKTGRVIGNLTALLATLKGLPLAYNRDLQEDKEAVFDSHDTVYLTVRALTGLFETITFESDRMQSAADAPLAVATDLAEELVRGGMPFRAAHALVGELVRESLSSGTSLCDLATAHHALGENVRPFFEPGAAARARTTPGGGGPMPVGAQLERARQRLSSHSHRD